MLRKFQGKIFAITEVIDALLGHLIYFMFFSIKLLRYIFSIWVYFHEYSQFIGHQEKGEATSSTPLCHFHSLHKHLDISWAIIAESSPVHKTSILEIFLKYVSKMVQNDPVVIFSKNRMPEI